MDMKTLEDYQITRRKFGSSVGVTFLTAAIARGVSGGKKEAPAPPVVLVMEITATNAPKDTEVRARVESFVEKVLRTAGAEVKEGDLLSRTDDKPSKGEAH